MSKVFFVTNSIAYANDRRDPVSQKLAVQLISELPDSNLGVISTQILQEYASVSLTTRSQQPDKILRILTHLE